MNIKRLSRRSFLKMMSLGLAAGGSAWLEACGKKITPLQPAVQTATKPSSSYTPISSATSTTVPASPTEAITKTPATLPDRSLIVRSRHARAWQGETLNPEALRQMLDASVARLTGLDDALAAWRSLFKPHEKVAIKVNSILNGGTHLALALVVTECLQNAGIPAEQITFYDRSTSELDQAGYPVSNKGDAVRCQGTDGQFVEGWTVGDIPVRLSRILTEADALINIPILKAFSIGGLSFTQKNHYGSIDNPGSFHSNHFTLGVTGINGLDPIRGRTRLIIGDVLTPKTHQDWTNYVVVGGQEALLVGTDPVAMDAIGLQMTEESLEPMGLNLLPVKTPAAEWLKAGSDQGLGISDPNKIEVEEVSL
jgi:hypothetical protein